MRIILIKYVQNKSDIYIYILFIKNELRGIIVLTNRCNINADRHFEKYDRQSHASFIKDTEKCFNLLCDKFIFEGPIA